MPHPDTAAAGTEPASPGIVRELLVEVFLARGAAHHADLGEAAEELRELLSGFGVLTDENEALILRKVAKLEQRAGRARLHLVASEPPADPRR